MIKHTIQFYWNHKKGKFILTALIAFLIIADTLGTAAYLMTQFTTESTNFVKEVWANLDNTTYERIVTVPSNTPGDPAVIMEKIAKCESGGTHYKKDGTLVKNINKNGTIDVGRFQINSAWEAKAHAEGFNIYLPEGKSKARRPLIFP